MKMTETASSTVGRYLAARLAEIGLDHYFAVPGDYNLVLLDEVLKNPDLEMISCCNELNAGYAADGYARATGGCAAAIVTYSVGGLSLLNAVAGAYAEDLPLIAVSGGPNTNSVSEYEVLHHTLGKVDYGYPREIFARVTAEAVVVQHPKEAPRQIDRAIATALRSRKPVYIEIACNIANAPVSQPHDCSFRAASPSDPKALEAAAAHANALLSGAEKPVLVAGVKLRTSGAEAEFRALADALGCGVASMPNAKGFFDEQHLGYMGIYWGPVSSPGCSEIVESADLALFAGPIFTDYTTTGHTTLFNPAKDIVVEPDSVILKGQTYNQVNMAEFLSALSQNLEVNDASLGAFKRIKEDAPPAQWGALDDALTTRSLFARVQAMLTGDSAIIAETGDSWFNGMRLDLPSGSRFEIQMQYGSIGWSVGATLGYCLGSKDRKVVALIGDGSFQMTAQEVSTMIRYDVRPIIFLINNGGYTIEVEIHDGPYNTINNWNYAGLMEVFNAADGKGRGWQAATNEELDQAIAEARDHDGPALIEVAIDRDDCSKTLLTWGAHVAKNNGRPSRGLP
jgi:TPP-dependent 2-oxoacid decarboxylase